MHCWLMSWKAKEQLPIPITNSVLATYKMTNGPTSGELGFDKKMMLRAVCNFLLTLRPTMGRQSRLWEYTVIRCLGLHRKGFILKREIHQMEATQCVSIHLHFLMEYLQYNHLPLRLG